MNNISLEFTGYWRDLNKQYVPNASGIYLVYACKHNVRDDTVDLNKLLYIGESGNVGARLLNHERQGDWTGQLSYQNELCYSFAAIGEQERLIAEAALIHHHKPVCNYEYMDHFPYELTTVLSSGRCSLITTPILVQKTQKIIRVTYRG